MRPNAVVRGFTQLALENLQRWGPPSFSGQPAPVLDCQLGEERFPYTLV